MRQRSACSALQGAFAAHASALADARRRRPSRSARPPTSTASTRWSCPAASARRCRSCSTSSGLFDAARRALADGLPVFGTCAGHDPAGHRGPRRPARPAQLRRHRHHGAPQRLRPPGRQLRGRPRRRRSRRRPFHGVFIRAPLVERGRRTASRCSPPHDGVPVLVPPGRRHGRRVPSRADRRPPAARAVPRARPSTEDADDVRPFQVGNDQAQEGRRRQGARQAVHQARPPDRGGGARGRRRPRRQPDAAHACQKAKARVG